MQRLDDREFEVDAGTTAMWHTLQWLQWWDAEWRVQYGWIPAWTPMDVGRTTFLPQGGEAYRPRRARPTVRERAAGGMLNAMIAETNRLAELDALPGGTWSNDPRRPGRVVEIPEGVEPSQFLWPSSLTTTTTAELDTYHYLVSGAEAATGTRTPTVYTWHDHASMRTIRSCNPRGRCNDPACSVCQAEDDI